MKFEIFSLVSFQSWNDSNTTKKIKWKQNLHDKLNEWLAINPRVWQEAINYHQFCIFLHKGMDLSTLILSHQGKKYNSNMPYTACSNT